MSDDYDNLSESEHENDGDEIYCECCGQRIRKLNPHHLDKSKLHVLLSLRVASVTGSPWCKMLEGEFYERLNAEGRIERARTAYLARAHALRLTWFGLAESKGKRTGEYRITPLGEAFLAGKATVPKTIWCRDGVVEKRSEEQVSVSYATRLVLDKEYWDRYPEWQRTLGELAAGDDNIAPPLRA